LRLFPNLGRPDDNRRRIFGNEEAQRTAARLRECGRFEEAES